MNDDFIGKIIEGDCLEIMPKIADKSIDLILADLPYGTTSCHWDTIIPFEPLWAQYKRIIKDNGAIVLTASQPFTSALVMSNPKMFKYEIIWEKERPTNIFLMKKQVGKVHENILVFYKNQPTYNPQKTNSLQPNNNTKKNKSQSGAMTGMVHLNLKEKPMMIGNDYDNKKRFPRSVLSISRNTRNSQSLHPTQKPVALGQYLIRTYTNKSDIVLDNVCGSGSFLVAAQMEDRKWIGIEKEKKYCKIAQQRINDLPARLF